MLYWVCEPLEIVYSMTNIILSCLSHQPTSCPLCGTTCRAPSCARIFRPTSSNFRGGNTGPFDTDISRQLFESISQVDEHTPLISLRRLYETANDFLKRQSRNCVRTQNLDLCHINEDLPFSAKTSK